MPDARLSVKDVSTRSAHDAHTVVCLDGTDLPAWINLSLEVTGPDPPPYTVASIKNGFTAAIARDHAFVLRLPEGDVKTKANPALLGPPGRLNIMQLYVGSGKSCDKAT